MSTCRMLSANASLLRLISHLFWRKSTQIRSGLIIVFNPSLRLVTSFDDARAFIDWVSQPHDILGIDIETTGLDWWRDSIRMCQFGSRDAGWAIPWEGWSGLVHEAIERYNGPLVAHNAKFEMAFLETNGVPSVRHRLHDTRILAHLDDNRRRTGLKPLSVGLVDKDADIMESVLQAGFRNQGWDWSTVPIEFEPYWSYAALDPVLTVHLFDHFTDTRRSFARLYDVELALQQMLVDMERRGVGVDVDYIVRTQEALVEEAEQLAEKLKMYGITRPSRNSQVSAALISEGVELTERTDTGAWALGEDVLRYIEHPIAELVLDYRKARKFADTYLANFLKLEHNGRIHASINQIQAITGRMSISRPSLQNLPRSPIIRDAFVASPGHQLLLIDYDQIEYRLFAEFAGMSKILQAARSGEDLHTTTARAIYKTDPTPEQRSLTKNATFAKLYGAGVVKFAETARISESAAAEFMARYDEAHPEAGRFARKIINAEQGFVETPFGRRLFHDEEKGAYVLVNFLVQGTAADVLKHSMVALHMRGLDKYLLLPVHDELVFDVPNDEIDDYEQEVISVLEDNPLFGVPLTVGAERAERWGEKY